jgi:hypothetical protein
MFSKFHALQLNEAQPPIAASTDEDDVNIQNTANSSTEPVNQMIDQNIEINSNKQMREEYLNSWTLKFKDMAQESNFCQLREDMFR